MTKPRVSAIVAFSGTMTDSDPDRAAAALQRAGYRAERCLPAKLAGLLLDPNDDFLETEIEVSQADEATIDAVHDQIEAIAKPFSGFVEMWGATEDDHLPFEGIFGIKQMRHDARDYCADCKRPFGPKDRRRKRSGYPPLAPIFRNETWAKLAKKREMLCAGCCFDRARHRRVLLKLADLQPNLFNLSWFDFFARDEPPAVAKAWLDQLSGTHG